jgi:predicted ATPase
MNMNNNFVDINKSGTVSVAPYNSTAGEVKMAKKMVITSGACAGKTSVINALKAKLGQQVVFVPEVATILLSGGFPAPEIHSTWQDHFQEAVNATQYALEGLHEAHALEIGAQIIICDRGRLDGAAYCGGLKRFCELYNLNLEEELARYHTVYHLESLATADPRKYGKGGNEHRYETLEQAQALEYATREAWKHHPQHVIVEGSDLEQKIARIISEMRKHLGEVS